MSDQTKLPSEYSGDEVFEAVARMVRRRELPDGFRSWDLANSIGWTIAHMAALNNILPPDFNQWYLRDIKGWTVAHVAAFVGNLPDGFNQWDLKDNNGYTVKEICDMKKLLPDDFDDFDELMVINHKTGLVDFNELDAIYKMLNLNNPFYQAIYIKKP